MTVGELKEILKDRGLNDEMSIIVIDSYTGAFVKKIIVSDSGDWYLGIHIDTEQYI